MKDKLVTKNYIEILAANFLLYFGFYLLMPVLPFYLAEVFNSGKGTMVGYFCQKATLFISLFSFYGCLWRISVGRHTHFIHTHPHIPRLRFWNGHCSGKYGSNRYYAQLPAWRRIGILWNDEQHSNEYRADGRIIST